MLKANPNYTFIYGLTDPRTSEIVYIGKSNDPHRRVKYHVAERHRSSSPKALWIQELWDLRLRPNVRVIMKVPFDRWGYFEQQAIDRFGGLDSLLNVKPAGNQPPIPWDEEHRRNHRLAMQNARDDISARSQKMWADPEYRER